MNEQALDLMNRWLGNDIERAEQRDAVHRVADLLRTVAPELVRVDPEATSMEDLLRAEDVARTLLHEVGGLPQHETSPAKAALPAAYLFERSPITGATNAIAAPLRIRFGNPTVAQVVYTEQYEGPAGGVHGGVVAGAFDEILGVAQMAAGVAGYTGTLEVKFRKVTPLHTVVTYEAGVERRDGRKLHLWARSTADDELRAEATGIFIVSEELPLPDNWKPAG